MRKLIFAAVMLIAAGLLTGAVSQNANAQAGGSTPLMSVQYYGSGPGYSLPYYYQGRRYRNRRWYCRWKRRRVCWRDGYYGERKCRWERYKDCFWRYY